MVVTEGPHHVSYSTEDVERVPGAARTLAAEPDACYADSLVLGSILRDPDGTIVSIMWVCDPSISPEEAAELPESFKHYIEKHHG